MAVVEGAQYRRDDSVVRIVFFKKIHWLRSIERLQKLIWSLSGVTKYVGCKCRVEEDTEGFDGSSGLDLDRIMTTMVEEQVGTVIHCVMPRTDRIVSAPGRKGLDREPAFTRPEVPPSSGVENMPIWQLQSRSEK